MVDNREAFYSTNVVMEADAITYLNCTHTHKNARKGQAFLVTLASNFLGNCVLCVHSSMQQWLCCRVIIFTLPQQKNALQVFV